MYVPDSNVKWNAYTFVVHELVQKFAKRERKYCDSSLLKFILFRACSAIGYNRNRIFTYLNLEEIHLTPSSLLHQMFHILGRYHEHQRSDRDDFVQIIQENIKKGRVILSRTKLERYLYIPVCH